jgi:hypothetical protein
MSGTSGTSGPAGSPGSPGSPGPAGTSGTSGGGGGGNELWIIASHSGSFYQDNVPPTEYYVGNSLCGWDSCDWDVPTKVSKELIEPVSPRFANTGIPNPFDLQEGDVITLCGLAWSDHANPGNFFRAGFTYFNCGVVDGDGNFPIIDGLALEEFTYTQDTSSACFSLSATVQVPISACDNFFQVVLNSSLDNPELVKFSWQFSVYRP